MEVAEKLKLPEVPAKLFLLEGRMNVWAFFFSPDEHRLIHRKVPSVAGIEEFKY